MVKSKEAEPIEEGADSELLELPAARGHPEILKKLDKFGVHTFEMMAIVPPEGVVGTDPEQITDDKFFKLREQARDKIDYHVDFNPLGQGVKREFISTGSNKFNELLGGGYLLGEITELTANWGIGKTNSCVTAAVMAWEQYKSPTVFIHSEFHQPLSAARVLQIAKARGIDYPTKPDPTVPEGFILPQFIYVPVTSTIEQEWAAMQVDRFIKESKCKLLVVDSLLALYRVEFQGRGQLAPRQQHMGAHLKQLARLALMFHTAVIITTPAQADPGTGVSQKPAGGAMLHLNLGKVVQFRPATAAGSKGSGYDVKAIADEGIREVTLTKAFDMPVDSRMVRITNRGMDDIETK